MNNQIILTKLYDDSINIPLGSVLTHFNNKKIQPYNVLEILTQIKKWNKVNNSSSSSMTGTTSLSLPALEDNIPAQDASLDKNTNTSLILKFRIDVDENESDNLFLSSIHPRRGIFLQELNQKVKTKFGIVLNDDFLIKWCGIYG